MRPERDRFHLLGHQPPERLFPAIAAADVVALPSLWEAFGLVALEGMALGKPCVLTSGSGFEDFFRDGVHGLMLPPARRRHSRAPSSACSAMATCGGGSGRRPRRPRTSTGRHATLRDLFRDLVA